MLIQVKVMIAGQGKFINADSKIPDFERFATLKELQRMGDNGVSRHRELSSNKMNSIK